MWLINWYNQTQANSYGRLRYLFNFENNICGQSYSFLPKELFFFEFSSISSAIVNSWSVIVAANSLYLLRQIVGIKLNLMSIGKEKFINPLTDFGFKKLFGKTYEESLKHYLDIKNVVDTSLEQGRIEGKIEGKQEGKQEEKIEIARKLKIKGMSNQEIADLTGLSEDQIRAL